MREALLALRRAGYTSTFLLTHLAGASSPAIHTRLDSHTHYLVAGALAQGEQGGVSPHLASLSGCPQAIL